MTSRAVASAVQCEEIIAEHEATLAARKAERERYCQQPVEPTGDGYVFVSIVLHNGAEVIAKRSPNRLWWWETLPVSGPDAKWYGSWDDMLDHFGRRLPLTVVRLVPADQG